MLADAPSATGSPGSRALLFSSLLIGLREGLEAALVVSILVAFLVKTDRRPALRWVWPGVAAAVLLSIAVGAILTYTTAHLTFEHQELVGGVLSIVAVAFVTAMIFWMRTAARHISAELRGKLENALKLGPLAIAGVSFLSVGREGLETSVFFYASVQTAQGETAVPLLGFAAGIVISVALAWLLYRGALRFDLGKFFKITGVLLVFVAAGVLGYGLHDLQGGKLPPRPVHPGLRRLRRATRDLLVRHAAQGHLQLLTADHRAAGDRLGDLRGRRTALVPPARAEQEPQHAGRDRSEGVTMPTAPRTGAVLSVALVALVAACDAQPPTAAPRGPSPSPPRTPAARSP
jgi:high-affinity iron transporter